MSTASEWRVELGREIVGLYRGLPSVEAAAVGGSAARGQADDYSDIDLAVYWSPAVSAAAIKAARVAGDGVERFTFTEAITGRVWLEQYWIGPAKVDIAHIPWEWLDEEIGLVLDGLDTTSDRQDLLDGLLSARTAFGQEYLQPRIERARADPGELAAKMVREHLFFYPPWVLERHGLARGDLFHYYDTLNVMLKNVMGVLAGVNRRYVATGKLKRIEGTLGEWERVPDGAVDRVCRLLGARDVGPSITALVTGTLDLVDAYVSEVETEPHGRSSACPCRLRRGARMSPFRHSEGRDTRGVWGYSRAGKEGEHGDATG